MGLSRHHVRSRQAPDVFTARGHATGTERAADIVATRPWMPARGPAPARCAANLHRRERGATSLVSQPTQGAGQFRSKFDVFEHVHGPCVGGRVIALVAADAGGCTGLAHRPDGQRVAH